MRPRPHPYVEAFPRSEVPTWLEKVADGNAAPTPLPLADVLRDSCFYPSSGLDASPVLLANGHVHSFVFVDYSLDRAAFLAQLYVDGFSPYKLVLQRDVSRRDLVPPGWAPKAPQRFDNPGFDGRKRLMDAQSRLDPFGHWSIWRRREWRGEWEGPGLFSFLFLGGEAVASYQGLYARNEISPKVMALIQPGHALGDNWTNLYDPKAPLWSAVSQGEGTPERLLIGGTGTRPASKECPFDGYRFAKRTITYEDGRTRREINVFEKAT